MLAAIREAWRLDRVYRRVRDARTGRPPGEWVAIRALPRIACVILPPVLARQSVADPDSPVDWQLILALAAAGGVLLVDHVAAREIEPFYRLRAPRPEVLRLSRFLGGLPWIGALAVGWAAAAVLLLTGSGRGPWADGVPFVAAAVVFGLAFALYGDAVLRDRVSRAGVHATSRVLARLAPLVAGLLLLPVSAGPAGMAFALALMLLLGADSVRRGDAGNEPRKSSRPARTRLPAAHPGRRGMRGAALAELRARLRVRSGWRLVPDLLSSLYRGAFLLRGPACAALGAWASRSAPSVSVTFMLLAASAPPIVALRPHPRLWLLGVDARVQRRAWLRATFTGVAVPSILAALAVTGLDRGASEPLLLLVGLFLARGAIELWWPPEIGTVGSFAILIIALWIRGDPVLLRAVVLTLGALLAAGGLAGIVVWLATAGEDRERERLLRPGPLARLHEFVEARKEGAMTDPETRR